MRSPLPRRALNVRNDEGGSECSQHSLKAKWKEYIAFTLEFGTFKTRRPVILAKAGIHTKDTMTGSPPSRG